MAFPVSKEASLTDRTGSPDKDKTISMTAVCIRDGHVSEPVPPQFACRQQVTPAYKCLSARSMDDLFRSNHAKMDPSAECSVKYRKNKYPELPEIKNLLQLYKNTIAG